MISKQSLIQKIAVLRQQEQQALATANAAHGAIQFAESMIAELEKEEQEAAKAALANEINNTEAADATE